MIVLRSIKQSLSRNDLAALALISIVFVIMCAVSWQKWISLCIDSGREMNLPLRLLNGESLYRDAYYLYGPLPPYWNALLYRIFGIHLNTLYFAGIISSFLMLLLLFLLGRQFMGTLEATVATLAVEALCVFKHGGHSVFPYTFSALYGTLLGLTGLILLLRHISSQRNLYLTLSGVLGGLALISKMEFGGAILATTLALILTTPSECRFRIFARSLLPMLAIPIFAYIYIAYTIPPDRLFKDAYFLPQYIPRELIYFNRLKSGLNNFGKTMMELGGATMILCSLGGLIGLISLYLSDTDPIDEARKKRWLRRLWWLSGGSCILLLVILEILGTVVYVSPLRALPLLCVLLIYRYLERGRDWQLQAGPQSVFLLSIYSLTVLARVITRVPSGGAYGLLLPVPILFFTYAVTTAYPLLFSRFPKAAKYAGGIVLILVSLTVTITLWAVANRYRREPRYTVQTSRGTVKESTSVGPVIEDTLNFIAQNIGPQEYFLAMPEGSSLNFLAGRPVPLRYEVLTPGFLDIRAERQAIQQLREKRVKFVFLMNRPTPEFGAIAFGRDYCRELMQWIEEHYEPAVVFGNGVSADSVIGDKNFFIKCYRLKSQ